MTITINDINCNICGAYLEYNYTYNDDYVNVEPCPNNCTTQNKKGNENYDENTP